MNVKFFLISAIALLCVSCHENDAKKQKYDCRDSLQRWEQLKKTNGNSYVYAVRFVSWVGCGNQTTITVRDGKPVAREFVSFCSEHSESGNWKTDTLETYHETLADLESHEKGARPFTIDELYDSCLKEYLIVDADNNTIYFETGNDGIMSTCGFVPSNCADDCFHGIKIDSFRWLE